jgi:hypothetical protein
MAPAKGSITLKLASWQVRMAKDYLSTRISKIESVSISSILDKRHWVTYRVPIEGISKSSWLLYLTDLQIKRIQEKYGIKTAISALNITEALIKEGTIVFA